MKASNFFDFDFKVESIKVPEKCKQKPANFDNYVWVSQDNRCTKIHELDDRHILNIYKMLIRTIQYAKELSAHVMISNQANTVVKHCAYHIRYIGYEVYLRFVKPMENKYQMKDDGDIRQISAVQS